MAKCPAVRKLSKEDGVRLGIGDFPNFSVTGSITGMRNLYYGRDALLVRCGGFIYHVGNEGAYHPNTLTRGESIYYAYAQRP